MSFIAAEICRLNYCRLYLQALSVSDITKTTGDALDQKKAVRTPIAPKPSRATVGKRMIVVAESKQVVEQGRWQPPRPLHKCFLQIQRQQNHCAYRYWRTLWIRDTAGEAIYQKYKITNRGSLLCYRQLHSFTQIPPLSTPVKLRDNANGDWQFTPPAFPIVHPPKVVPSATATFDAYIKTLEVLEIDLLRH